MLLRIFLFSIIIFLSGMRIASIFFDNKSYFPRDKQISFEARIKNEVKQSEKYQIIRIRDAVIFADLYPQIREGETIRVSGYIDQKGVINNPEIKKISGSVGFFGTIREKLSANFYSILPQKEAILVVGTVLGNDEIPNDLRQKLIDTGTIHVVVVSGQNLMLLSGLIMAFARYLGRRNSLVVSCIAIIIYSALVGFDLPVMRASIIVLYTSVGLYLGRQINSILALLFAAIMIILIWPASIFEISFQLTFAASLGIITLGQKLSRLLYKVPVLAEIVGVSCAAYIFTTPIILYHFGKISLIAPIANIFVSEAVLPIMIFGMLASIFSLVFMPIAYVFAYLAYSAAYYFWFVVEFMSRFEFAKITINSGNLVVVLVLYLIVFSALVYFKNHGTRN